MFRVEGKKIVLMPLLLSDAREVALNANDRLVNKLVPLLPFPYELKHAKEFIRTSMREFQRRESCIFGIHLKGEKKLVGVIGFKSFDFGNGNSEVGYWIGSNYWHLGIGSEALELLLGFGFNELGLNRAYAVVRRENLASRKLLEKLGFKFEGTLRKHLRSRRGFNDGLVFGILKSEFL